MDTPASLDEGKSRRRRHAGGQGSLRLPYILQCELGLSVPRQGRKESKQARMFTGEWAGYATNTQASECMWAPDQLREAAVHRLMRMPDRYAKAQLATAVVQAFDRNLKALQAFVAKEGGALATFQKERFTLDCQGDALHFGGPERATRIPGEEYEDE